MTPLDTAILATLRHLAGWQRAISVITLLRGLEHRLQVPAINEVQSALRQIREQRLVHVFDFVDREWRISDAGRQFLEAGSASACQVDSNQRRVLQALLDDSYGWSNDAVIAIEVWNRENPKGPIPDCVGERIGFDLWPVLYSLRDLGLASAGTTPNFMWIISKEGRRKLAEIESKKN